jgi:serine protease Do
MARYIFLVVLIATWTIDLCGQTSRFIVDDDSYSERVVKAAQKLLQDHKLLSLKSLRSQVQTKGSALKPLPLYRQKLDPPELCDRLRESTLAVGTFYKCPDCGEWHFSSSAGFVAGETGIVCTCCHVVLEEDEDPKEAYLIAADSAGSVFPVQAVLAADTDSDTCLLRIEATGLKPLPLRTGVRAGESVYCLSHPGGYYFMFTQGLVARLNRRTSVDSQEGTGPDQNPTRPILLLNITAEFAQGSSGAAVVDACGNVVGQVSSIADAGEPSSDEDKQPAGPSVPIRFCTATEEILRLTNPNLAKDSRPPLLKPARKPKQKSRQLTGKSLCPFRVRTNN